MNRLTLQGTLILLTLALGACVNANGNNNGSGGTGGSNAPPRAAIVSMHADPATVSPGGTSTLSWTTTDATSCVASDAWSGTKATNGSETVTLPSNPGSYTYTLSCSGPGGSNTPSSVTITVGTDGAATVVSFRADPATVQPGGSSTLSWTTQNASSCTASDNWSGTKSTSGSESVTPPSTPNSYLYTLTCTGPGGQNAASSITVTVAGPANTGGGGGGGGGGGTGGDISGWNCTDRHHGTGTGEATGTLCEIVGLVSACQVVDPQNAADGDENTFAEVDFPIAALGPLVVDALGLNGTASVHVDLGDTIPAGQVAAFDVELPGGTVELDVLQDATLTTFAGGEQQEQATVDPGTGLDLLELLGGRGRGLIGFQNTKAYDAIQIDFSATLAAADVLGVTANVYDACTNAQAP
ncbi:MAG TPA: hypothetical protein VFB36_07120 [Nevskiaceae bacterium]|nr:hypothetical protein [Nevskiaceae bacterium]